MNAEPILHVHPDQEILAAAVARRLVGRLAVAQHERGEATVVLTGGSLGINTLKAVAVESSRTDVDWSRVNFWWGDERFVAKNSPDRNELQARQALLDLIEVDESRVHPFGCADEHATPFEAADAYAEELREAARSEGGDSAQAPVPTFDVLLLGVGPDAHIASLFPEMAGIREEERTVIGVENSPKPPPARVSLTLPAINSALEIWLVAAGDDKAGAVGLALAGAGPVQVPAAAAKGRQETLWMLDQAAASQLPDSLRAGGETF